MMVAALFVEKDGAYYGLPDVDPWPEERDARLYDGPWPVVAHPPCQRWGRFWFGGTHPSSRRYEKGADAGCFASALASVRRWGGVLEHPSRSLAWGAFGLIEPPAHGGWVRADWLDGHEGWTCEIEQAAYGHQARKKTWLYACGVDVPSLRWGETKGEFAHLRATSSKRMQERDMEAVAVIPRKMCAATPIEFRDLLLSIARSAKAIEARRAETEGLGAQHESAAREAHSQEEFIPALIRGDGKMPTGLTYKIAEGSMTELRDFALVAARSMMFTVTMRDDGPDAALPQKFEPGAYHSEALSNARAELAEIEALTDDECGARAKASWEEALTSWTERRRKRYATEIAYNQMIEKVEAWKAPELLVGMKDFMLKQLNESKEFDCPSRHSPFDKKPVPLTAADWRAERLATLSESIAYHSEEWDREVQRTDMRNKYLAAFHEAFPAPHQD